MQQSGNVVRRRFHEAKEDHDERTSSKKFPEILIKGENHLLPAEVSFGACEVMKCIGHLDLNGDSGVRATGFRIAKQLIMTCQHVVENMTAHDVIQFNQFEPQPRGSPGSGQSPPLATFHLKPELFYYESTKLDFAVIGIVEADDNVGTDNVNIISCVNLVDEQTLRSNHRVNIFSHARGKRLRLSQHGNVPEQKFEPLSDDIFLHEAETEVGSSGAPVFDEKWQLIGIHEGAESKPGQDAVFYANYGTLIKSIINEMFSKPEEPLTGFERKLQGKEEQLGVPFAEFSKKLEDKSTRPELEKDPKPDDRKPPSPSTCHKTTIVISRLLVVVAVVLLFQRFYPGSSLRYWYCRRGSIKDHDLHFTFTTMTFQVARVHGIEFEFHKLKKTLGLDFDAMQNSRDMHHYFNLDRCAHGGVRQVASFLDGLPMVRGAEVFAVDHKCTTVFYHSEGWHLYKSARKINCSSHP